MNKLLNLLIRPHLIPKKIVKKINHYLELKKYNQDIFETNQNEIFEKQKLVELELIFKRISAKENCVSKERKFIAIFKKT